ncbi:MAG: efflux RND transporter periplasmic adaptor subunit [Candidatus Binataceae bacterium]
MNASRSRLIALAVAILAVIVVLVWLFGVGNREEGDEEDQVTAAKPILSHASNGDVIVALSREQQARIGLKTVVLASVSRARLVIAYGVIVDPAPLAALDAELASARAALDASKAEYARTKLLNSEKQSVSLKDFQAARAKFQSDQAQVNLLSQRLADQWGAEVAAMAPAERAKLIDALISRAEAIMRVSVPSGQSLAQLPARAEATVLGYSHPFATQSIWYAPAVDPNLQGQGFMLRVNAQGFPLRPGQAVTARLESSAAERGVVVPSTAVVRAGDAAWAYVQVAPTKFERRAIATGKMVRDGWFVSGDFAPEDRGVVVTGAQALLSEEFKSQIQVQD